LSGVARWNWGEVTGDGKYSFRGRDEVYMQVQREERTVLGDWDRFLTVATGRSKSSKDQVTMDGRNTSLLGPMSGIDDSGLVAAAPLGLWVL